MSAASDGPFYIQHLKLINYNLPGMLHFDIDQVSKSLYISWQHHQLLPPTVGLASPSPGSDVSAVAAVQGGSVQAQSTHGCQEVCSWSWFAIRVQVCLYCVEVVLVAQRTVLLSALSFV